MQVTLANLRARVWGRLDDNQLFYPQAQVDRIINESARLVNLYIGFSQDRVFGGQTAEVTTDQINKPKVMFYRIPSPIIIPMKLYIAGKEVKRSTPGEMGESLRTWLRGDPYQSSMKWVPIGLKMYALSPPDQPGNQTIEVMGITTPRTLVNANDTLNLDDGGASIIEDLSVMGLVFKEGNKTFADVTRGMEGWFKKLRPQQEWVNGINPLYQQETQARMDRR